jgi:hypothetical protein
VLVVAVVSLLVVIYHEQVQTNNCLKDLTTTVNNLPDLQAIHNSLSNSTASSLSTPTQS